MLMVYKNIVASTIFPINGMESVLELVYCISGIGRGLMSGILLLNLYFDKHRSLATGLGSSGVGIGSLWVVPLTQYLFSEYNFSVSMHSDS